MLNEFIAMFLLAFAIASMLAGGFTAYFSSGKTKITGVLLIMLGLVVGFYFVASVMGFFMIQSWSPAFILNSMAAVFGAFIGILSGIGLFLFAIFRN